MAYFHDGEQPPLTDLEAWHGRERGDFFVGEAPAPAPAPARPAGPVFRLQCPAGCPPVPAARCLTVLRQAILSAIQLASNAERALKQVLEPGPRARSKEDEETVRLFRAFFGHDPSRPVPWAGNQASGASVAYRFRKVAEALQGRGTLYRCGCPGAGANIVAQTNAGAEPNVIELCPQFWNPPAGLRLSDRFFRAGTLIHEMLHLLFHEFFHHQGHPSGDPERRRDNSNCYESFALRVAGHAADPSAVRQCRVRPG